MFTVFVYYRESCYEHNVQVFEQIREAPRGAEWLYQKMSVYLSFKKLPNYFTKCLCHFIFPPTFSPEMNPPKACEYVRIWVREGNWIQYFQLNLPVSSISLHLDFYCASLILNSQMLGFNFSRKQVTS